MMDNFNFICLFVLVTKAANCVDIFYIVSECFYLHQIHSCVKLKPKEQSDIIDAR